MSEYLFFNRQKIIFCKNFDVEIHYKDGTKNKDLLSLFKEIDSWYRFNVHLEFNVYGEDRSEFAEYLKQENWWRFY